jgi:hypothetical protein
MDDDAGFRGFRAGQHRPPHHSVTQSNRDGDKPPEPLRKKPIHQWSVDLSEAGSGDTGTPRNDNGIPWISVSGASGMTPVRESVRRTLSSGLPSDLVREGEGVEEGTRHKKAHSKDRKKRKKKHRTKELLEDESELSLPMHEVGPSYTRSQSEPTTGYAEATARTSNLLQEIERGRSNKKSMRDSSPGASESARDYSTGRENPAFERSEIQATRDEQRPVHGRPVEKLGAGNDGDGHNSRQSGSIRASPSSNSFGKVRTGLTKHLSLETMHTVNQVSEYYIYSFFMCTAKPVK